MNKKVLSAILAIVIIIGTFNFPAFAAIEANQTVASVIVNGENLSLYAYVINNNMYFKLRDIAYILNGTIKQFEVSWDSDDKTIALISGEPYTAVGNEMASKTIGAKVPELTGSKILVDGKDVSFAAYLIDGNHYVRLNDIGAAFDFGVSWNRDIAIDTGKGYDERGALFVLGYDARESQPKTVDEFIPIFAEQYKRYNGVALEVWPGNTLHGVPIIIEDVDTNRLWLIEPDGAVSSLPEDKAKEMGLVQRHTLGFAMGAFGDFYVYDDRGNIVSQSFTAEKFRGMYFTVNQESMDNVERWGKWPHVSTFDVLRFSIHESFHTFEQSKWQWQPVEERANYVTKDQFFEAADARIKRDLLISQLMAAVSGMGDKKLILDALATYADYKENYNEDYVNALYWDRVEGTAEYIEFIASIYSYFPEQIKSKEDAYRALAQLGTMDYYRLLVCGVIDEAYMIGAFTGILLDMLGIGWKTQFMSEPMLTPMEMLYQNFVNEALPKPIQPTQSQIDEVYVKIRGRKDGIIISLQKSLAEYEERLKTASEQDKARISKMIENYKNRIEELSK